MKKVALAIGLALSAFAPQLAEAREVPIGDFFKDPEFSNVSISPSGEYITVSRPQGDRTLPAAFRVSDMQLVGKWDYGSGRHIDRVQWVNNERFFMYVSRKIGRFDFRVGTPDVYASNVDGTKRIDVPNGGLYSIVDTMDEDPNWILVQRSIDSAYLFKMNVNDGRTVTVASAPLRYGSFLVDADRNVRFAMGMDEQRNNITLRRDGDKWTEVHRAKGYKNWGTTMIDDMTDAVDWAVREGIADGNRVCTYGASYGGYGALQSVVRNPTKYKCTVGYVGVYSLPLMKTDGDITESKSGMNYLSHVLPDNAAELQAQSAVYNVDKINVPVMLVQGGKDVRVPPSQYNALKDALAKAGKPVEVDVYEAKEAHGFYDYDNQVSLYTKMQAFFDKHIGKK